jgi:hypothetical protein
LFYCCTQVLKSFASNLAIIWFIGTSCLIRNDGS